MAQLIDKLEVLKELSDDPDSLSWQMVRKGTTESKINIFKLYGAKKKLQILCYLLKKENSTFQSYIFPPSEHQKIRRLSKRRNIEGSYIAMDLQCCMVNTRIMYYIHLSFS